MPDLDNFSEFQDAIAATGGEAGTHWLGTPSKLPAKFLTESVQVFEPGDAGPVPKMVNGLPVYKDELHIKIFMPGGDVTARRARDEDKFEYPQAWEAFQRGETEEVNGIPLKEWPQATPAVIATLNAANVFSVEGLSELSDAHCETIGNMAFIFRDKAQKWLEQAQGNDAKVRALETQNAEMAEQLRVMQEQIAKMTAPKKRGRPAGSKNKPKVVKNVTVDDDQGDNGPPEPAPA